MARTTLKNICRLVDIANTKQTPEKAFLNDLKKSIEIDATKGARKGSQSYKPSSMNCIRSMWYIVTGKEGDNETASYNGIGICNSGTDIHARIQQSVLNMIDNGIDCEYVNVADYVRSRGLDYLEIRKEPNPENGDYETKLFHTKLNMSFLCDGIIKYQNHYYILELKTETCNKWYSREDVDPNHYNQGTAYSIAFNIPEVIFVYISRDNLDMKSFMFVPTDEQKENLIGKIEECDGYVKRMICPPKPVDVARKTCEYCGYKTQCRKDL